MNPSIVRVLDPEACEAILAPINDFAEAAYTEANITTAEERGLNGITGILGAADEATHTSGSIAEEYDIKDVRSFFLSQGTWRKEGAERKPSQYFYLLVYFHGEFS